MCVGVCVCGVCVYVEMYSRVASLLNFWPKVFGLTSSDGDTRFDFCDVAAGKTNIQV